MRKPPRGSTKAGMMCSYDTKTGLYTDRWLWEEISGEGLSAPFPPRLTDQLVQSSGSQRAFHRRPARRSLVVDIHEEALLIDCFRDGSDPVAAVAIARENADLGAALFRIPRMRGGGRNPAGGPVSIHTARRMAWCMAWPSPQLPVEGFGSSHRQSPTPDATSLGGRIAQNVK